jgi:hypothetical protein
MGTLSTKSSIYANVEVFAAVCLSVSSFCDATLLQWVNVSTQRSVVVFKDRNFQEKLIERVILSTA